MKTNTMKTVRRNAGRAATVALMVGGVVASTAVAANAAVPSGAHRLKNVAYDQCIEATGHNKQLKLANCNSGSAQFWTFVAAGPQDTYFVVNSKFGECMEVNNGTSTPGEVVDLFTCNGGTSEQWVRPDSALTLQHAGTNQALDTVSGRGSGLMQFTIGMSAPAGAQAWQLDG